jgi:hypothetical protein
VPDAPEVALTTPLILPGTAFAATALSGHSALRISATPLHEAIVVKHLPITIAALPVELGN